MTTLRVIVADDEKWVRTAIVNSIPFDKLGMSLVCEAFDGLEALEQCRLHQPDILITDIMMPELTGLDLIKELKKSLPGSKVIIISGHNDFEYAKTAMKYGVQDFIVKPVDEEELEAILSRVKETIIEERKHAEEEVFIKSSYTQAIPILQEMFLNQIIQQNTYTSDSIIKKLAELGISLPSNRLSVAVLYPDDLSCISSKSQRNYYKNLFSRIIKRYTGGFTFLSQGTEPLLVAIFSTYHDKAFLLCSRIYKKRLSGRLSIGISSSSPLVNALPELFRQASEALANGFWSDATVFHYREGMFASTFDLKLPTGLTDEMVLSIKAYDNTSLNDCIERIAGLLKSKQVLHPDIIKEYTWSIIQSVTTRLDTQDSSSRCSSIPSFLKIREARTFSELSEYFTDVIFEISSHYSSANSTDINGVETAKKLMAEYYTSDLSLEFVAKSVHFNPTYFSEVFKKQTGMSFIDYKIHLRIESAKVLLGSTSMSIAEISMKVGYSDPKYFSRLFKKVTGVTMQEYKKNR